MSSVINPENILDFYLGDYEGEAKITLIAFLILTEEKKLKLLIGSFINGKWSRQEFELGLKVKDGKDGNFENIKLKGYFMPNARYKYYDQVKYKPTFVVYRTGVLISEGQ